MRASEPADTIYITGLGMVSSLGYDVMNSCAAARAGISRAGELDYFRMKSVEDGEEISVLGHQVPNATIGFEGLVRLLILSRLALEDLLRNSSLRNLDHSRVGLHLALPDFQRVNRGIDLISDEEIRNSRLEDMADSPADADEKSYGVRICQALTTQLGLTISPGHWFQYYAGHCGVASAIQGAVSALRHRDTDYTVVGGVDSLIEAETLQWLLETGRLKTDGVAVGLQPGEASAFLLLERYETAAARGARIFGRILELARATEEATLLSGKPVLGIGLSQTIVGVVAKVSKERCLPFWIVTDQNGETYRASEWGYALTRLLAQMPELGDSRLWYPAVAFGDTGAASGFIAICMVIYGFVRGYGLSDVALILSSSEDSERSSILVARP